MADPTGNGPAAAAAVELLSELVDALPGGGEPREGQREMTALVATALATHGRLAVRAGTGTGKSLALLAAIATSGKRTVVATATKALQDQYANKELPFVDEHHSLTWSVLKGRSNYVCLSRLDEARRLLSGEPPPEAQEALFEAAADDVPGRHEPGDLATDQADRVATVMEWATDTDDGDLAELPFELDARTASWVATGPDGCPGADRCAFGQDCFAEQAIDAARASDVVLVNTSLLGADLALEGALLGDADAYVLDEAHEAEDILASAFGAELRGDDLANLERNIRVGVPGRDDLRSELRRVAAVADRVLAEHVEEVFRDGFPTEGDIAEVVARAAAAVAEAASEARAELKSAGPSSGGGDSERNPAAARAEAARRNADQLAESIERLSSEGTADAIWVEDRGPTIKRVPIDVAERLRKAAWGDTAVVLTSATVSEPMVPRLGMGPRGRFEDVGSPFDHRAAAMLYVPPLLSGVAPRERTPNHPDWFDEAWSEAAEVIRAAEGRTLLLCTSMRNAREFAALARDELDWPVLLQGELPKPKLLAEFAHDPNAVAVGTMGLWQGVDVAGDSLSCVIVDKLPFPRPDDPLWQARADAARLRLVESGVGESDAGYRAFLEVQVPRAASLLAQGTGRLIRSATDRGLVVVLDPRLAEKAYRKAILDELPPMRRTRTRSEAIAHLRAGLDEPHMAPERPST
ncbi:MAG: ATP-dependent DNA helicase [Microthrixaceae bacterium]